MVCRKVPIRNVSFSDSPITTDLSIQSVLGDITNVPEYSKTRNINLKDTFLSPIINSNHIDSAWCPGNNDAERLVNLSIDDPMEAYNWIQYGGCEEDYPEIYFSNLKGWNPNDIELLEGGEIDYTNSFPAVALYPDGTSINSYYTNTDSLFPGSKNQYSAAYYRTDGNEFLQKYGVSAKVKVDTVIPGALPDNINFKLKITMVLGSDYLDQNKFYYSRPATIENESPFAINWLIPTIPATGAGIAAAGSNTVLWDSLVGDLVPVLQEIAVNIGIDGILGSGVAYLAGAAIAEYIILRAGIELADVIYDTLQNVAQTKIKEGDKYWTLFSGGNYNNYDIRESSLAFNHDIFKILNNQVEIFAKNGVYNTNIINYNTLDLNKWFNFDSRPRGANFDKITLPPQTMYIVEIVPISNCKISSNPSKPHIISFFAHPDKYVAPRFDVIPSNTVCGQAMLKLQDAIYADHIYLQDKEVDNLFDPYRNIVINTANYKNNETSLYFPYTGEDIIQIASTLSGGNGGKYDVLFMKDIVDREQQLVYNSSFIDRGYGDDDYNVVKKYWNLDTNWKYSGGAIYKANSTDTLVTQLLPGFVGTMNWDAVFKFDIEIVNSTNGQAYLDITAMFYPKLCDDKYNGGGVNILKNPKAITIPVGSYPAGVSLVGNRIYFNGTGKYTIFLQGINNNNTDRTLKLGGTSTFNGGISDVKLKRLSALDPLDANRAVPMYNESIIIGGCPNITNTIMLLLKRELSLHSLAFTIGNFQYGSVNQFVDITVNWGDGTTNDYHITTGTQMVSHYYNTTLEMFSSYLVKITINGYVVASGAPIVPYFQCNSPYLLDFADYSAVLPGCELDFSYTSLLSSSIIDNITGVEGVYERIAGTAPDGSYSGGGGLFGGEWYVPILSKFLAIKSLKINNTSISNDLYYLGGVTEYIDISNTNITGDLSELSLVSNTIIASNSKVNSYSSVPKMHCKNIWWQDTTPIMTVIDLHNLCRDLYNSSITGGRLFIASNNPKIIDEEILWFIFQLVHEFDWIVVYNGYYVTTANQENYLQTGTDDYIYTHNP
jgi:hypothetical protein